MIENDRTAKVAKIRLFIGGLFSYKKYSGIDTLAKIDEVLQVLEKQSPPGENTRDSRQNATFLLSESASHSFALPVWSNKPLDLGWDEIGGPDPPAAIANRHPKGRRIGWNR